MQREEAKRIIRQTFERPFEDAQFKVFIANLLNRVKEAPFVYRGNTIFSDFREHIESLERVGEYEDAAKHRIDVLIVRLKRSPSLERARATQRSFVAKYLKSAGNRDAALVAFVTPDEEDWRFSFVKMQYAVDTTGAAPRIQEEFTPAKRYSFLVGKNENSHTAQTRLLPILEATDRDPTLDDIEDAFSVEKVTKEFFEQYRELFLNIKEDLDRLTAADKAIEADFRAKGVDTTEFAKKLLGQIVFLYFLQKKGWFGVARTAPWGSGPKHFLRNLFQGKHGSFENFFNDILEPLFYNTLAVERTKDFADRFNCRIPFLNGGLFDPLRDYDWVDTDIALPNALFSNTVRTPRGDVGTGVLDVFDRYNFTVKEDEPLEKEVAVDPEMLGKVFENLLEVKDRRSKGTYYTPREVVHYMCQASLTNALSRDLPDGLDRDAIELLVKHGETAMENDLHVLEKGRETKTYSFKLPDAVRANAKLLDDRLAAITVCDPAVGSGAFLVGMMTEIVRARQVLAQFQSGSRRASAYDFKRQAIQHSLYGVDIDPAAVEIAKLRLWLSLVVDEEGYELIQPLPNLDYKIMQGNSLIEEFEGIRLIDEALLTKLDGDGASRKALKERQAEIEREFLALHKAGTLTAIRRAELDKQAGQIQRQLKALDVAPASQRASMSLFGKDAAQSITERLLALHERFFAAYHRGEKERLRGDIDSLTWDLIETTLTQKKRTDKLEEVKRYQQISTKPFFIWKLHFADAFRDASGFHVVIVNPPYGIVFDVTLKRELEAAFPAFRRNNDLYVAFIQRGLALLGPSGALCVITPNTYLNGDYFKQLRHFLTSTVTFEEIVDYKETPVFDDPMVFVSILLCAKQLGDPTFPYDCVLKTWDPGRSAFSTAVLHIQSPSERALRPDDTLLDRVLLLPGMRVLDDLCFVKDVGFNYWTKGKGKKRDGTSIGSRVLYSGARRNPRDIPFMKGRDIAAYAIATSANYLRHDYQRHLEKDVDTLRFSEAFLKRTPKIVYRQTASNIIAALDEQGRYCDKTVHLVVCRPEVGDLDLRYVLGLLNSKFLHYVYAHVSQERAGRVFSQVKTTYMKQLPIPATTEQRQKPIVKLVEALMKLSAVERSGREGDGKVKAVQEELDRHVYALYGLGTREIEVVEGQGKERGRPVNGPDEMLVEGQLPSKER